MKSIALRDLSTGPGGIRVRLCQQQDWALTANGRQIAILRQVDEGEVQVAGVSLGTDKVVVWVPILPPRMTV